MFKKKLIGGRTLTNVYKKNNKVYREEKNKNELSKKFLLFLKKNKFNYSPKYYGKNKSNLEVYSYINGYVPKEIGFTNIQQLITFLDIVVEMHKLSNKFMGEKYFLIHQDLSPCNTVFDKRNNPIGIIDWDTISIGDPMEDYCYIIWLWVNIGDPQKKVDDLAYEIAYALIHLNINIDDNIKKYFINRMNKVVDNMSLSNYQYIKTKQWVDYCKNWIEKNWKIINSELEKLKKNTI